MPFRAFSILILPAVLILAGYGCSGGSAREREARSSKPADLTSPVLPLPADFHRGVNHAHVHRRGNGYGSAVSAAELDSLRRLGVNWIAITPFAYQPAVTADGIVGFAGDTMPARRDGSLTDEDMAAEIASAHRLGIKVALKPHIWSRDFWGGGEWHGTVRQNSPAEHARWWNSYRAYSLHYARFAEQAGADLYCIGTELVQMTAAHPDEWRALIADIRKVYHGELSYAAHWDKEVGAIPFWDALDYIGVTAYFPLNVPDSATTDMLIAAWKPHRGRLEELAAKYKRPVLFLEAGYRPVAGTYREPWLYSGGTHDPAEQARAYDALFRAFADAGWWRGVYIWKTFTDPYRAGRYGEDLGFRFRGLPAQDVIARWYRGER